MINTKNALFASILLCAATASAQEMPIRFMPEPDFENAINVVTQPMKAKDAFAGLQECGVADAKTFKPVTIAQAQQMLAPCVVAVGRRYNQNISIERLATAAEGGFSVQIEGLAIYVPENVAITDALMKDLNRSLEIRNGRVLGHPVVIRRGAAPSANKPAFKSAGADVVSAVQNAVDACFQPMSLRRIETAEDFILYYGRCIAEDKTLKVRELHPAPGHPMSVNLVSMADVPTVRSLNGAVKVAAANGLVTVSVIAYPETIYLP